MGGYNVFVLFFTMGGTGPPFYEKAVIDLERINHSHDMLVFSCAFACHSVGNNVSHVNVGARTGCAQRLPNLNHLVVVTSPSSRKKVLGLHT
jgi:hypothetical protein